MAQAKNKVKGASSAQVSLGQRLKAWRKDHRRVAKSSLQRLLVDPVSSLMTWAVIGIALALPVGLYVALGNVQSLGNRWEGSAQISLFLQQNTSANTEQKLLTRLAQWPEIEAVHVISKQQGLEEFQALSGFADVLTHLSTNPLPVVIEILPAAGFTDPEPAALLLQRLQKLPPVELAQLDLAWVQRLAAMLKIGQRLALGLVI